MTLKFDKKKEKEFLEHYYKSSIKQVRNTFAFLIIFYSMFSIIDYLVAKEHFTYFSFIRYGIVIPVFIAVIIMSYSSWFIKIWQLTLLIAYLVSGVGICLMLFELPLNHHYLLGMMLIFSAGFILIRLRFLLSSIAGLVLIMFYNIGSYLMSQVETESIFTINAFYVCAVIIGMMTNYYHELSLRRNFSLNKELRERGDVVDSVNDVLSYKVEQKNEELEKRNKELLAEIEHSKEIEKELIVAKDKAESANRMKSTFIANMSHEIRTPINAVLGLSEILLNEIISAEHRQFVSSISQAGNVLLDLVSEILDFSQLESSGFKSNKTLVDMSELLDEMHTIFWQKIDAREIHFETSLPDAVKLVYLDKAQIRQVLINLIGNSIKFTDHGTINLKLSCQKHSDDLCDLKIVIEDSGVGIPEEDLENIFIPFIQSKNGRSSSEKGTGLGLAITKRIVEGNGGTISVSSKLNLGTTFTILLPKIRVGDFSQQRRQTPIVDLEGWDFQGKVVLVVDDILINRKVLRKQLEKMKLEVHDAESAKDALALIETNHYDLFCFDLRMPDINGSELSQKVRKNKKCEDTPIICITASINPEENYILEYFNAILFKPCKHNQIAKTIDKVLKERQCEVQS